MADFTKGYESSDPKDAREPIKKNYPYRKPGEGAIEYKERWMDRPYGFPWGKNNEGGQ